MILALLNSCTINNHLLDSGSCENIITKQTVEGLKLLIHKTLNLTSLVGSKVWEKYLVQKMKSYILHRKVHR